MQRVASSLYYELVQAWMDRMGCCQREAEQALVVSTILKYQALGFSTHDTAKRLQLVWGMNRATYYRRLRKARETVCIP